jgi:hypothetical protein
MTVDDRATLQALDAILRSEQTRAQIQPIVERVRADLATKTEPLMAWEPIPLSIYGNALPAMIRSSWVFILRAGVNTGAERHPNSHQRMMSWEGSGDMQTEKAKQTLNPPTPKASAWQAPTCHAVAKAKEERSTSNAEVKPQSAEPSGKWQSDLLVSDPGAPLERRWISIPENVWHRPVVSKEADWVVVSFHTVPAEELIEERPSEDGVSGTRQMRYLG